METKTRIIKKVSPEQIPYYSDKDLAYQVQDSRYDNFYKLKPNIESFKEAIELKSKQHIDRDLLAEVLSDNYAERTLSGSQKGNLKLIKDKNTYTLVTAHQPSLFTGPMYVIYKICSTIKLSHILKEHYPNYNFIPLFISGSEDHDFAEINHANLFGKEIKWDKEVEGSVGRIFLDEAFKTVIDEFTQVLGENNFGNKIKTLLEKSYEGCETYAEFNFNLINELFSDFGLIVINMDNAKLKRAFLPVLKQELIDQPSQSLVQSTQEKLGELGFSSQAYPREINLFYLQKDSRKRIEESEGKFYVVDSDVSWSKEEVLAELEAFPERFSPNVVTRPLYQEFILPNLAYIGGGGEIAYWLERKSQFEHFNIPYPILVRRNSAMIVPPYLAKQIEELELNDQMLFDDENAIINVFLANQTNIDIQLTEEIESIDVIFDQIAGKAEQIDPPLAKWVLAEGTKTHKLIEQIESRIKRSIKKKEENKVKQISKLKNKLFPNNGLQERFDNFFQYYLTEGDALIEVLIEEFNPLENKFSIIYL